MITGFVSWITGKLAGPILGAALVLVSLFAAVQAVQLHGFMSFTVDVPLIGSVHFGYAGALERLADARTDAAGAHADYKQCRINNDNLNVAVGESNKALDALAAKSATDLADAKRQVGIANAAARAADRRVAAFLALKPAGATVCEKFEDIDKRVLEALP